MANQRSIQTSLFSLTNNSTNPNQHSVAIKNSEFQHPIPTMRLEQQCFSQVP